MKVLVTGMTSAQCNPAAHRKSHNYVGTLWDTLRSEDHHEVFWRDPSVSDGADELKKFDRVFVGVGPISALGANRVYGALSVIEHLWGDERLVLVVDAPEPQKMQTALKAVIDHPENLTKPFFSYRKDYNTVVADTKLRRRLLRAVTHLAYETWPTTVAPALPWHRTSTFIETLPFGARNQVSLQNFDYTLFDRYDLPQKTAAEVHDSWVYEPGSNPAWTGFGTVGWGKTELPRTFRVETNELTSRMLRDAAGCLISPTRYGTWWSPRYAMSMAVWTPVFTEWRESSVLDSSWSELPGTYESYSPETRLYIAECQREAWLHKLQSREQALQELYAAIRVDEPKARKRRRGAA